MEDAAGCGCSIVILGVGVAVAIVTNFNNPSGIFYDGQAQKIRQEEQMRKIELYQKAEKAKDRVQEFLASMNPELDRKVKQLQQEMVNIDQQIQKYIELKNKYPKQSDLTDKAIQETQTLKTELQRSIDDIDYTVEGAYVAYRINEILGAKKFTETSKELLKKANDALTIAQLTQKTIAEQITTKFLQEPKQTP